MNKFTFTKETFLLLSPLFFLQISLAVYCGSIIFKEGVKNLSKWAWFFICLCVSVIGPVLFLLIGRRGEFR